jgi:hypothetical protein
MARWRIAKWLQQHIQVRSCPHGSKRAFSPRGLALESLEDRFAPAAVSWSGAGDGFNWSDPHNWGTGSLPTAADDVIINTDPGVTIQYTLFGSSSVDSLQSENALNFNLGSLTIAGPSTVDNTVTISGALATLTVNDQFSVQSFVQTAGNLTGSGTVEISEQWVWSDGQVSGTGTTILDSTGLAVLSGGFFSMLVGWTVQNDGSAFAVDGGFDFQGNAVWNNDPGSFFALQGGAALGNFFAGPLSQFNNQGVLDVDNGSGPASNVGIPLNNAGEVDVDAGTLSLTGGGASQGNFSLGDGSVLDINTNYTFNTHTTLNGNGTVQVDTFNTLTIAGNVRIPTLALPGGTVTAMANLTVANLSQSTFSTIGGPGTITIDGQWTWTSGNMTGPGRTVLNGTGAISGGFFSMLDGRTVDNRGSVTVTDSGFDFRNDAVWNNRPGSTLVLEDGASLGNFFAGPGAVFNNAGLLVKDGSGTSQISIPLVNNGTLAINSTSILQVNGNFTQGAFGSLQIDLGGTGAGVGYGQLNVTGTANLGGNLTVNLVNGFTPNPGDTYQILLFGSRVGGFASLNLPDGLSPVYGTHSLTLAAS